VSPRPKHRVPELEALIKEAERKNWRVEGGGNRYFKIYCPCGEHKKTLHLTPGQNYAKRTRQVLENRTCWLAGEGQ